MCCVGADYGQSSPEILSMGPSAYIADTPPTVAPRKDLMRLHDPAPAFTLFLLRGELPPCS